MIREALDKIRAWARALKGETLHDWFLDVRRWNVLWSALASVSIVTYMILDSTDPSPAQP